MNKKIVLWLLATVLLSIAPFVGAQQPTRVHRIGFLRAAAPPEAYIEAFRQGLRDLGWVEGKNISIEHRYAEGRAERLPDLAAELVRLKVDVLVASTTNAAQPAKDATSTIPIVMVSVGDPLGLGLIASLARPGGNITGLSNFSGELGGKRLELLKEIIPRLTRVAVIAPPTTTREAYLKETEIPARALAVKLIPIWSQGPDDFESIFRSAAKERVNALLVRLLPRISSVQRKQIVELAAKNNLPALYEAGDWVEIGGLMSYGVNEPDLYRRAAVYVDKILKGRKPEDLPVEQPMRFEFIINLKSAKQIGLTIPPNVLVRADKVIK